MGRILRGLGSHVAASHSTHTTLLCGAWWSCCTCQGLEGEILVAVELPECVANQALPSAIYATAAPALDLTTS